MTGLVLATCDRALGPMFADRCGAAPDWVHLWPEGKMTGRDGRSFDLADAPGLVLAFQSGGIDLPIDYEHQNDRILEGGARSQAIRPGGRGLSPWWTGRQPRVRCPDRQFARKEYRYLSPSFLFHPKTRQILCLKGAGPSLMMPHNPNLHLTALASQETDMPPEPANPQTPAPKTPAADTSFAEFGAELASLLGLPAGASPKGLMAKLSARLMKTPEEPDPSKYMPVAAVQEMLSVRRAENDAVAEGRAQEKAK